MGAPAELEEAVSVALIGRTDEALAQLQAALTDLGADVVFQGEPADIDLAALRSSSPGVVIVNLDASTEDALDHLQPVLDDPHVNVIFNESDVTRQLGGWDLARWARHLAAKVLGHQDTNPPPPPGAEGLPALSFFPVPGAPPTPAQMAGERMIEEFTVEADDHADDIPTDYLPMEVAYTARQSEHDEVLAVDLDAIEGALAHSEARAEVAGTAVPDAPPAPEDDAAIDFDIDLSALDEALSTPAAAPAAKRSPADEAALLDAALEGLNLDLDPGDDDADASGAEDVDPFDDSVAAPDTRFSQFDAEDDGLGLDDDLAALAARLDTIADAVQHGQPPARTHDATSDDDLQFDEHALPDEPLPDFSRDEHASGDSTLDERDPADPAPESVPAASPLEPARGVERAPAVAFDFSALELAPLEDDDAPSAAPAPTPVAAAASFDFDALELSLEPLSDDDGEQAAAGDEDAGAAIRRVIVLGASIGGPDALRTFLGGIPEGFPALFVLAQHLDNGFFERLAQQLQKSSNIPVRVANPDKPARHGEVLLVPAEVHFSVEPNGSVVCEPQAEPPRYRPCIDDVMRTIAERYRASATAIVFSGMAGDAIEGSVYVTSMGGEVWAQSPESCVVSSMVDGACARGVVEFTGTPRELAERCVAKYGRGRP